MHSPRISADKPLAEITLRRYPKPYKLEGRELVKRLCLSIGLLQPGDSRDVVVDVLHTIVLSKQGITADEIAEKVTQLRKKENIALLGTANSNIRRQLKRLKDLYLIERIGSAYRVSENSSWPELFEEKIEKIHLNSIVERVKEYFNAVQGMK